MPTSYSLPEGFRMRQRDFDLAVSVNGERLREVNYQGKTYLVVPDHFLSTQREFVVSVTTPYNGRHECVVAVDGLDILTGEIASSNARGYVVTGGISTFEGWRRNNSTVAAFKFVPPGQSYAGLTNRGANVGVIGVVFFSEQRPKLRRGGFKTLGAEGTFDPMATRGGHDVGTGYGQEVESHVSETTFAREGEACRLSVEYATASSLRERGILDESPLGNVTAFPGDKAVTGCQPPPGWRG
jgi:hypothetical protein